MEITKMENLFIIGMQMYDSINFLKNLSMYLLRMLLANTAVLLINHSSFNYFNQEVYTSSEMSYPNIVIPDQIEDKYFCKRAALRWI